MLQIAFKAFPSAVSLTTNYCANQSPRVEVIIVILQQLPVFLKRFFHTKCIVSSSVLNDDLCLLCVDLNKLAYLSV